MRTLLPIVVLLVSAITAGMFIPSGVDAAAKAIREMPPPQPAVVQQDCIKLRW